MLVVCATEGFCYLTKSSQFLWSELFLEDYLNNLTLYGSSMCDIAHPSLNLPVTFHTVKLEAWEN